MLQLETKSTSAITALAFSPDGSRLLVGYAKGPMQEWDAFGGVIYSDGDDTATECAAAAWLPNGASWAYTSAGFFIAVNAGEKMEVFGIGTGGSVLTGLAYFTEELAVIGQGHPMNAEPGALRLRTFVWEERRGQPQALYEASGVRGLDIHRDSRLVAWITGHARLKLWRTDRPDVHEIPLKKTATRVAVSADGQTVAAAVEWVIHTFSTATRHPLHELKGHKGKVTSLAFSPDGRTIVTGGWDDTVREWDAATGKELRSKNWKVGKIAALSYAPDGTRIAAGTTGGKVIVWDVE